MIRSLRRSAIATLFIASTLISGPVAAAEKPQSMQPIAGFETLVLLTGGASADQTLPMIIGLHYSSAQPETIVEMFDAIDFPARVVLPRGQYPRRDGYSWFAEDYAAAADQKKATLAVMGEISTFIDAAVKQFPTRGKPAMFGVSYGGDLSYLIAVHHPEQIAAAFPVAARFPSEWLPDSPRCTSGCPPLLVMHGTVDAILPIEGARDAARRLEKLGVPLEFREYSNVGHDFPPAMKADFTKQMQVVFTATAAD